MDATIRPLKSHEEYRAVEQLQRDVWRLEDVEIVPHHLLLTVRKNGGVMLGAFEPTSDGERLVGFVLGFPGFTPDGQLKHCSHMAAVAPDRQGQNIGYRLKFAQRQRVLDQGFDLVTWTFDPLESLNARLNLHKLGAVCDTYLHNLYGDMRNDLNAGLPSDRFQVDWHIASQHVTRRLESRWQARSLTTLLDEGVPLVNPAQSAQFPQPPRTTLPFEGGRLLIQIPADFQPVKSASAELALRWRLHTRQLFDTAFAAGYTATDLLFEDGRSCYLLEKDWRLHED